MAEIRQLSPYRDSAGNEIVYAGTGRPKTLVRLRGGSNNRLIVDQSANIADLTVDFWGDDGLVEIGPSTQARQALRFAIRVGHASTVRIGSDVGCQGKVLISAVEGADVTLGDDVMFAVGGQLRSDDSHAIYEVATRRRANPARSIRIGHHVWFGENVVVMGGVSVGDGSVLGLRSVVTRSVPNNCVAAGAPARVVRRDVVWERPMNAQYRPGTTHVEQRKIRAPRYWRPTADEDVVSEPTPPSVAPAARRATDPAPRSAAEPTAGGGVPAADDAPAVDSAPDLDGGPRLAAAPLVHRLPRPLRRRLRRSPVARHLYRQLRPGR